MSKTQLRDFVCLWSSTTIITFVHLEQLLQGQGVGEGG